MTNRTHFLYKLFYCVKQFYANVLYKTAKTTTNQWSLSSKKFNKGGISAEHIVACKEWLMCGIFKCIIFFLFVADQISLGFNPKGPK